MNCLFPDIFGRTSWMEATDSLTFLRQLMMLGKKEAMYVASESEVTCVCDKSWAGGRRGAAQGPLRIK